MEIGATIDAVCRLDHCLNFLAEIFIHIEQPVLQLSLPPSLVSLQGLAITTGRGDPSMPIGTSTLMTIALRRRLSPETLNTIIDLSWLIKDWALGLGSALEIAMSQMTLLQARFPDIGQIANNESLSEIWTWVVLPCSCSAQFATGASIDPRRNCHAGK